MDFNPNFIPNAASQVVGSVCDMIAQDNLNHIIGKKKKNRRTQQRSRMLQPSPHFPQSQPSQPPLQPLMSIATSLTTESFSDVKSFEEEVFVVPKSIDLRSGGKIALDRSFVSFSPLNCETVNESLLNLETHWHMILVYHQNLDKRDIIQGLSEVVDNEFFVPIAYNKSREVDYFFIARQCGALKKLFAAKLKINVKGTSVNLNAKLRLGSVSKIYQPFVFDMVIKSIKGQIESASLNGGDDVLDLCQLSDNFAHADITIDLGNKAVMTFVFDQLNGIEVLKTQFRIFKFENNNIKTLEPFTKLFGFNITKLDLRHNRIKSIEEFHFLKHLKIDELYVNGNECAKYFYRDRIHDILTSVASIDGQKSGSALSPTTPVFKLEFPASTTQSPDVKQTLKSAKGNRGAGNDPIKSTQTGVEFRGDNIRRKEEFTRIKENFHSYRNDAMWTVVTVQPNNFFKSDHFCDEIVPILFNNCSFYPCYYKRYGNRDEFFLYKNFEALKILMKENLVYQVPARTVASSNTLIFSVRLNAAEFEVGQVDWFHKMIFVVQKRIRKNILNLDNFPSDPEFSKMIVPMNTKWSINFILDQASKGSGGSITRINAQGNGIQSLEGFQTITMFPKLVTLDLRNNKISSLVGISMTTTIKELRLDGNPICDVLSEPYAYVGEVKKFFPELEWLDGHRVNPNNDLVMLQNFLVKRDAYTIADEFVKTYFNIYDSFERLRLRQMYRNESIFSLSCNYEVNLISLVKDIYNRMHRYVRHSRNTFKISDMSMAAKNVMIGDGCIGMIFADLPKTTHDFGTLCVDVPYYKPKEMVVITTSGVFQDHGGSASETNFVIAFVRTFVLKPTGTHEYFIANEQLFLHSPSQEQSDNLIVKRSEEAKMNYISQHCADVLPTELEEKQMKLLLFQELTELKKEEAIRQLEECHWDLKVTLATFNTLMDSQDISDDKFDFK